jgi:YggT family protein
MSAVPPADPDETPRPELGLTAEERGRDVNAAQAEMEAEASAPKKMLKAMSLRLLLSQAEGYPVVLKQFIQFCLILIYPAWVFGILSMFLTYYLVLLPLKYVLLAVFWVLFWPLRMRQKKKNPEEYEAYKQKYWK